MIKYINNQPDEEIHSAISGRVPSTEASDPLELGFVTLLACECVHQPQSSLNPIHLEFLWSLHPVGMINH